MAKLPKKPDDDEHLSFKLLFGLMEGHATGKRSVTSIVCLALLVLAGKAFGLW
ncbi:hypothetical protein BLJAPNOD_01272 [Ensifer sp. M14]|nr:hypothetical protein BLJAPNOD_01272 [Ensifer sp. M14]